MGSASEREERKERYGDQEKEEEEANRKRTIGVVE
jgi:hypothetical protein